MVKKRLISVITVKNGWAVQSFGYRRYLPMGKPEVLVQNLDRWGSDEILIQCIDRYELGLGPDMELLKKISMLGIATPLIYAGGIRMREDAVKVVSNGADRIMVDSMLLDSPSSLEAIARDLGTQAVIAHLPVRMASAGLRALNYRDRNEQPLNKWLKMLPYNWISEVMVTDWINEGSKNSFDDRLLDVSDYINKPLLCFGGISEAEQMEKLLAHSRVMAVGVGNFLNYREHAVQLLKAQLKNTNLRGPHFANFY